MTGINIVKIFEDIISSFPLNSTILLLYVIRTITVVFVNDKLAQDLAFTNHTLHWEYVHKMPKSDTTMFVFVYTSYTYQIFPYP